MRSLLLSLALLLLTVFPSTAQRGPERGMWKNMNLTTQQTQALADINAQTRKQMIDLRATISKKRVDLRSVMDDETPDRATVEQLTREISDLQVQQKMLRFDSDRAVMKELNPEQQKQWQSIKRSRWQHVERGMRAFGRARRDRNTDD
ncbi:MAG: periplasmic heavy metal sensor [Bacteroidota bacterium]|jgi:Spy/CpxP family protein refolding chaperone|nr:periplasmic heavy metal sensor [Bacteroidota bacterium]